MAKDSRNEVSLLGSLLFWRLGLAVTLTACLLLGGWLWWSGKVETENAFASGRRLLIDLKTGDISGRTVSEQDLAMPPAEPPAAEPGEPAENAAPETPAETAPAATEPEPPTPQAAEPATAAPVASTEQETPQPAPGTETPPATPPESGSEAPQAPVDAASSAAPMPLTYEPVPAAQLPVQPQQGHSGPAVSPEAAPAAPLEGAVLPAITPSSQKLPGVNSAITEQSVDGVVPVIAPDGTRAWRYYAKPSVRSEKRPMIAIIFTGLGENKQVSEFAVRMNDNVTLAFSPYARGVNEWGASARLTGHEVLIDLPMQPVNYPAVDPGPYGLMLGIGPDENQNRLRWLMTRIPTSVGFITPVNEQFTANDEAFKLMLQSLANHGLMLVMGREPARNETHEILNHTTTPNVVANLLIDEELSETAIQARLRTLEQLAEKNGYAVGVARAYPISVTQVKNWIAALDAKGIVLVPVSAIARLDFS